MQTPGVATLVLLGHRSLQFPPFFQGHGAWKACTMFERPLVIRFGPPGFTEERGDGRGLTFLEG